MVGQTVTNVLCNGESNGSINITANGGTTPYSYSWIGPNGFSSTAEDISSLSAGQYTLTLIDALGCNSSNSYTYNVTQPASLAASQTNIDILCFGENSGEFEVSVVETVGPYDYLLMGTDYLGNTINQSLLESQCNTCNYRISRFMSAGLPSGTLRMWSRGASVLFRCVLEKKTHRALMRAFL